MPTKQDRISKETTIAENGNYSLKHPFGSELPSLVPWIFQL